MKGFDDVVLFSVKPKYVENNKHIKRENNFEFYLLKAMLKQYLLHLSVFSLIPSCWRG